MELAAGKEAVAQMVKLAEGLAEVGWADSMAVMEEPQGELTLQQKTLEGDAAGVQMVVAEAELEQVKSGVPTKPGWVVRGNWSQHQSRPKSRHAAQFARLGNNSTNMVQLRTLAHCGIPASRQLMTCCWSLLFVPQVIAFLLSRAADAEVRNCFISQCGQKISRCTEQRLHCIAV